MTIPELLSKFFSPKWHWVRGYTNDHDGWDIGAPTGTPVYSFTSGVVYYAQDARNDPNAGRGWAIGGGNTVDIQTGQNRWQYAHLNSILVKPGQFVSAGQQIGTVGATGFTSGQPHLHFGIWDTTINKMINPAPFFSKDGIVGAAGSGGADTTATILQQLTKFLGKKPSDTFTDVDLKKIIIEGYKFPEGTGPYKLTYDSLKGYIGKSISDVSRDPSWAGNNFLTPIVDGVGDAITAVGQQLADTFTWIGVIILGVILIIGGIFLLKPTSE
jgi:hypothetical protein